MVFCNLQSEVYQALRVLLQKMYQTFDNLHRGVYLAFYSLQSEVYQVLSIVARKVSGIG